MTIQALSPFGAYTPSHRQPSPAQPPVRFGALDGPTPRERNDKLRREVAKKGPPTSFPIVAGLLAAGALLLDAVLDIF